MKGIYHVWGNEYPNDLIDIIKIHKSNKELDIMVNEELLKKIEDNVIKVSKEINCQLCITYSVCMNKELFDLISECSILYESLILFKG
jgi:hypothetical protein